MDFRNTSLVDTTDFWQAIQDWAYNIENKEPGYDCEALDSYLQNFLNQCPEIKINSGNMEDFAMLSVARLVHAINDAKVEA
jgi:hypothetical protein